MSFGARAVISTDALRHNLNVIAERVPSARIMAVVKANGYGHGIQTVARALTRADSFAVARLVEAKALREAGIDKPILLLEGVWDLDDQTAAINQGCELVVHHASQIELLSQRAGGRVTVWLKVDTGMTRLGFDPNDVPEAVERLRSIACMRDVRLMTHFSSADERDNPKTGLQLERFSAIARGFDGDVSVGNSAAIFALEDIDALGSSLGISGEHWVRPGIALYGVSPFHGVTGTDLGLKPAMEFKARLIAVKRVRAGASVGYGETYTTPSETTIGVLAAGYGDGYSRHLPNLTPVELNGRTVPLIGRVSMDMITVDLGRDASDRVGDTATLWGAALPVEHVAAHAKALPYTFVTGVLHREEAKGGE